MAALFFPTRPMQVTTAVLGAYGLGSAGPACVSALYNQGLSNAPTPGDPLAFIRDCISSGRVRWTYHVTMRLHERRLTGEMLRQAVGTFEIIEEYPRDKYLPSFLMRGEVPEFVFHALIAADLEGDNVRVVTMYLPDPDQWDSGGRVRRIAE